METNKENQRYGLSITQPRNVDLLEVYEFQCEDKEFADKFSVMLHDFFNKHNGTIRKIDSQEISKK